MNKSISKSTGAFRLSLQPVNTTRLAILCGHRNENLHQIETQFGIKIHQRGHLFNLVGTKEAIEIGAELLKKLYEDTKSQDAISPEYVHINMQKSFLKDIKEPEPDSLSIQTPKIKVVPRGKNQQNYVRRLKQNDLHFVVGPAGTGKTFLAVAAAIEDLERKRVSHICLVRPAVEAGETLGFLPGTLMDKINPYLQPLFDALNSMLGFEETSQFITKNIIEVSALAYMRGRTLNNCFAILDEGQNASREQMKMFLTRIGFNSKAVVTGDLTQIDLSDAASSGLVHSLDILSHIKEIGVTRLTTEDIVRHSLVIKIIKAYEKDKNKAGTN